MLIHLDGTLNLPMLKFFKEMTTVGFIEMCLSIPLLDPTSWLS